MKRQVLIYGAFWGLWAVLASYARGQSAHEEAFLGMIRAENGSIVFADETTAQKIAESYPDLVHRRSSEFDVFWGKDSPVFVEADLDSDGKLELLVFFDVKTGRKLCKAVAAFRGAHPRWTLRDILINPAVAYEYVSTDEKGVICRERAEYDAASRDSEPVERLRRLRMNDDYLILTPP
jgi:hypothetical protein